MISTASRPYIDASVPVLRAHGLAISTVFYQNIFAELPELTKLFNMGNQANGAQQQSLASAVFAYAANIGAPEALAPVIERIVHKHVSVGIRAEHYPIVGRHLLGAIAQTLGDGATPQLLAAWGEAYSALAALFIEAENKLYADAGIAPGQTRAMRVTGVTRQSADVISVSMTPLDQLPLPPFKPGQYVSVSVSLADGRGQIRQYSLSDAPHPDVMRISVKREGALADAPAGEVSNWIHEQVAVGSVLQVSPPFGDFTIDPEAHQPLVMLSAGVGITPMIAALNSIAHHNPKRHLIFAHAARDAAHQAHQHDIANARARMPNLQVVTFHESADGAAGVLEGRMDVARLPAWQHNDTDVYLCGPLGFMQAQWRDLLSAGVPPARLRREVFGPEALEHLL
jgi:nitric oxide dioxygenase